MNTSLKLSKQLSFGEEIANSVTHAVGAVIMLILLPISSTYSYEAHGFLSSIGVSIFVISLFLMLKTKLCNTFLKNSVLNRLVRFRLMENAWPIKN